MVLFLSSTAQNQPVPDGTEGEVFDTLHHKKSHTPHRFTNWNYFDGPLTTLKLGGGFLYDYVTYIQDCVSKQQLVCEPAFKTRDLRFTMSGQFKFKREVTWKLGAMYDGATEQWLIRETGVMFKLPGLSGNLFIGRSKEGFSMNKIMNGYAGWAMERQMGIDVIPILADGIKYMGYYPKQRILFNIGAFVDWLSKNQGFSTYHWQFISRIGYLPVYSEADKTVLHLALSTRYGKTKDDQIRVRSRPESNPSPYFVDTDVFPSSHSSHVGLEAYYRSGPWMFGGEYSVHQFVSQATQNPLFHGGELMVSWIITGESRPYSTGIGAFGFVPVKKSLFKGGPGAWEAILRITNIDLNSGTLSGGTFWRLTPMVNWYLSSNIRLELVYGFGILNRFDKEGGTQFFQSRIQFML
jgi:phosphate-selective porin OprO/OprP